MIGVSNQNMVSATVFNQIPEIERRTESSGAFLKRRKAELPSGNAMENGPFIVDSPIKEGDFP